jgi:hypothetical protein
MIVGLVGEEEQFCEGRRSHPPIRPHQHDRGTHTLFQMCSNSTVMKQLFCAIGLSFLTICDLTEARFLLYSPYPVQNQKRRGYDLSEVLRKDDAACVMRLGGYVYENPGVALCELRRSHRCGDSSASWSSHSPSQKVGPSSLSAANVKGCLSQRPFVNYRFWRYLF